MLEARARVANAKAIPTPTEVPIERPWVGAGGVAVGGVGDTAKAEAEAAVAEAGCREVVAGVDVATPLPAEERVEEIADHVTTEGPGVFIYRKESVFPIVAFTNAKWQPDGFAVPAEENT